MTALISTLLKESETLRDDLDRLAASPPPEKLENTHADALALSGVLLFKYRILIQALADESNEALVRLREAAPDLLQTLENAWESLDARRKARWRTSPMSEISFWERLAPPRPGALDAPGPGLFSV